MSFQLFLDLRLGDDWPKWLHAKIDRDLILACHADWLAGIDP
jgi:hypothetical protein